MWTRRCHNNFCGNCGESTHGPLREPDTASVSDCQTRDANSLTNGTKKHWIGETTHSERTGQRLSPRMRWFLCLSLVWGCEAVSSGSPDVALDGSRPVDVGLDMQHDATPDSTPDVGSTDAMGEADVLDGGSLPSDCVPGTHWQDVTPNPPVGAIYLPFVELSSEGELWAHWSVSINGSGTIGGLGRFRNEVWQQWDANVDQLVVTGAEPFYTSDQRVLRLQDGEFVETQRLSVGGQVIFSGDDTFVIERQLTRPNAYRGSIETDTWTPLIEGINENFRLIDAVNVNGLGPIMVGTQYENEQGRIAFYAHNGATWAELGRITVEVTSVNIADSAGSPVTCFDEYTDLAPGRMHVAQWQGGRWRQLPGLPGTPSETFSGGCAGGPAGVFVMYRIVDDTGEYLSSDLYVAHWNGNAWSRFPRLAQGEVELFGDGQLVVDRCGRPSVAFRENGIAHVATWVP